MRDADPHHHKHFPHSHGFTHVHYKYDNPVYIPPPSIYSAPPTPHNYGAFSQAHAHSQSISQGPVIPVTEFGHSAGFAHSGAHGNTAIGFTKFGQTPNEGYVPVANTGFGGVSSGSAASAQSEASAQAFNKVFTQTISQTTAQATAQASAQAASGINTGSRLYEVLSINRTSSIYNLEISLKF